MKMPKPDFFKNLAFRLKWYFAHMNKEFVKIVFFPLAINCTIVIVFLFFVQPIFLKLHISQINFGLVDLRRFFMIENLLKFHYYIKYS